MYAQRDAQGIWKPAVAIDGNPLAGQQLSIDVEPGTNRPAIAYYDGTNADLKLAQWTGRRWTYTNLDGKGTTGQYPSLQFGPAGNLSIAYYDRTRMDASSSRARTALGSTRRSRAPAMSVSTRRSTTRPSRSGPASRTRVREAC
jgi:hypothetical protein